MNFDKRRGFGKIKRIVLDRLHRIAYNMNNDKIRVVVTFVTDICRSNEMAANVQGKSMNVRFSCKPLGIQIANITFPEVSENKDRILWSYNLSGGGYGLPEDYPSFMSLYYKKGKLDKIGFTFKCANPEFVLEFE